MKVKIPKDMDIKYTECTITTTLHEAAADLQKKLLKVQSYPLHNALRNNNKNLKEIKQLVMENSHNINLKDSKGKTPLHYAYKSDQNIKTLLANGADPDEENRNGETFLHLYCSRKNESRYEANIVELILEKSRGGILEKKSKRNKTAFDIAKETGKNDLLYLLDSKYTGLGIS